MADGARYQYAMAPRGNRIHVVDMSGRAPVSMSVGKSDHQAACGLVPKEWTKVAIDPDDPPDEDGMLCQKCAGVIDPAEIGRRPAHA